MRPSLRGAQRPKAIHPSGSSSFRIASSRSLSSGRALRGPVGAPRNDDLNFRQQACAACGVRRNLLNWINAILPVQSPFAKIFRFPRRANHLYKFAPSHPTRGAYHDRHETRGGMRWTRQCFARDGIAGRVERLVSDQQRADERCCSVRRSRVVLTPRRWRQVRGCRVGPTGLRQNVSPRATVAKEPDRRGEHKGNR
jgi:hypothetical protein